MKNNRFTERLNVFPDISNVDDWYSKWYYSSNQKFFPSTDDIFLAGQEYIRHATDLKIQKLLQEYNIEKSFIVEYNYAISLANNQNDWKSIYTGAGVGLGAAALIGISIIPLAAIGAAIGGLLKRNKNIRVVKEQLVRVSTDYAKLCAQKVDEILKIKSISESLILPPVISAPKQEYFVKKELTAKQLQIKNFLDSRGIKHLVHFTCADNVPSIRKYGILSIEELNRRNLTYFNNDMNRLDNKLDYISLSVTTINKLLLSSYLYTGRIKNVRIIYISASLLYEEIDTPRIYCDRNASAGSCVKGSELFYLENMFQDTLTYSTAEVRNYDRKRDSRSNNEPTDPQAEILFKGCVPAKYIECITETSHYGN